MQLIELRAQVARLEAALDQNHQQHPQDNSAGRPGMGMGRMDKGMMSKGTMGGMSRMNSASAAAMSPSDQDQGGMGSMKRPALQPADGSPSAPGMSRGMGMMKTGEMGKMKMMGMMGRMKGMGGMSGMSMQSALPGFPGASHLYHIGATGFFLDHAAHLQLTIEQQTRLNRLQEKAAMAQATADRKMEQAEQELWELTAADQPDVRQIETKIRETERLRGDQRLAFIRAVGEAAGVLTHEQHVALTGGLPPSVSFQNQTQ